MYRKIITGLLFVIGCHQVIYADEVIFKNGDRLTGKIKELARGKMILESQVADTVSIDVSKIQTFRTDEAVSVRLRDGTELNQIVLKGEPGFCVVQSDEKISGLEVSLKDIVSIDRLTEGKVLWKGDISAGLAATRGNSVTDSGNINFNLTRRTKKDRTLFSGYYMKSQQEDPDTGEKITTQDTWWTRGKYDYFFTRKCYVYGEGRYETDRIANLKRRVIAGSGLGRQWVEWENLNFSTDAGLASRYEKYTNQTDSTTEISGQLGYHFDMKLNSKLTLFSDLTYYPSMERRSDYLLMTTGELRLAFTEQMFTNFKSIFQYDSTPAQGARNTDIKYILGLGWKF